MGRNVKQSDKLLKNPPYATEVLYFQQLAQAGIPVWVGGHEAGYGLLSRFHSTSFSYLNLNAKKPRNASDTENRKNSLHRNGEKEIMLQLIHS